MSSATNDQEGNSRQPRAGRAGRPSASRVAASQTTVRRWEAAASSRAAGWPTADRAHEELARQLEAVQQEREQIAARMAAIRELGDSLARRLREVAARE